MPQVHNGAQVKTSFRHKVKRALDRERAAVRSVSALARKLRRPRTSVSRAINQGIFPDLQKEISRALKI